MISIHIHIDDRAGVAPETSDRRAEASNQGAEDKILCIILSNFI